MPSLDAHLQLDLGIDSLEWMALSLELERSLGIRLYDDAMAQADSVRDLLRAVAGASRAVSKPVALPAPPHRTAADRWIAAFLHRANRALVRGWFGLRVEGVENIPPVGPIVVVANHVSDLDPLALAAALPRAIQARLRWGADAPRVFGSSFARKLATAFGAFPVDERMPAATLAAASSVLTRGEVLVWFPESWRSPDGALQPFRPGIGALLQRVPVPVLPVLISGTFEAWPRDRRLPRRHPVHVRFGPAIGPDLYAAAKDPQAVADLMREHVAMIGR